MAKPGRLRRLPVHRYPENTAWNGRRRLRYIVRVARGSSRAQLYGVGGPRDEHIMSTFKQQFSKALLSLVLLGFYSVGGVAPALAAPAVPGVPAEKVVSADELNAKIEEIEAAQDLDEAVKGKLVELYRQALRQLERVRSNESSAKAFEEARKTAPEETAALRKKLEQAEAKPVTPEALKITNRTSLGDLEQRLVKEKANLAAVETKLAEVEKSLGDERTRPDQVRDRLTELKQGQVETEKALKATPPPEEAKSVTEARRLVLELRSRASRAEIHALDQELLSQGARVDLLKAQREVTAQSVTYVRELVKLLEELVNQRRLDEAEKAQEEAAVAERAAAGKHPALRQLAERNAALTRELAALTGDLERVTKRREAVAAKAKEIQQDFQTAQQRLQIAGLSETLGRILLEQRRKLPDLDQYRKDMAARKTKISEIGLSEVRAEEENRELRDLDAAAEILLAEHPDVPVSPEVQATIKQELKEGLRDRKGLLGKATNTYGTQLKALADLDYAEEQLLDIAGRYRDFLDEHLLWLPSASPVSLNTLGKLVSATGWLLSPTNWLDVGDALVSDLFGAPLTVVTGLLVIAVLLWNTRRLCNRIVGLGENVGKLSKDSIGLTFQALGLTLLLAVGWPALLAFLGWRLQVAADAADFARHVGTALLVTAPALLNLLTFHRFCIAGGVAERHFGWSESVVKQLRRNLQLFIFAALPVVFLTALAGVSGEATYRDSLSRLGFAVVMLLLFLFFWRVLNPRSGVLAGHLHRHPKGWLSRLRYVWYGLVLGALLALIVLDVMGYFHTAAQLAQQVVNTLWLVLGLVILHDLVIRWLTLVRRKLALQQLREKRAAERAARTAGDTGESGGQPLPEVVEEEALDLEAVDVQTRKLLDVAIALSAAVGLWLIWADVLPALGILDQVSLWQQTVTVEGVDKLAPVTLADLTLALLIALLTVVASKNLPGVMEIAFLQRLALTAGTRYAITTLAQYLIVAVGVILAFNTIGASWSSIQWLVAALSVGLGFGLQEIVANFISGLILLFERPIRVGDIVTVGDTTGVVSRIQIRATTIRNWDKQELLVPNKEFITGRLLNWTLSDQVNRIVIPVGVAYGSDVQKALQIISDVAKEHPRILVDPAPLITFEGFGDNALNLILRCYLDSLEFRLLTITELHTAINEKFNQAGIVIAFPQRDIHLDTSQPLEVRIREAEDTQGRKARTDKTAPAVDSVAAVTAAAEGKS